MALIPYDPFRMINQLQEEMNKLFENRVARAGGSDLSNVVTSEWVPAVDIKEEQERFVILADVPGVDPKDIEVTMENGVLTMKGQRSTEAKEEREGYTRVERVRGTFYRRFTLPDTADAERIGAKVRNGVLEVTIPKHERVQPRKISVEATEG
jgi:HSP20 family protein